MQIINIIKKIFFRKPTETIVLNYEKKNFNFTELFYNLLIKIIDKIEEKYLEKQNNKAISKVDRKNKIIFLDNKNNLLKYIRKKNPDRIVNISDLENLFFLKIKKKIKIWYFYPRMEYINLYGLDHLLSKKNYSEYFLVEKTQDKKFNIVDRFKFISYKNFWYRNKYLIFYYFISNRILYCGVILGYWP